MDKTSRSFRYTCASILIALTMICSVVVVIGFSDSSDADSEGDEDPSDPINGGTHWVISGDTLTISKTTGSGKIGCYASDYPRAPWGGFRGTTLIIEEGVTEIGTYAFYEMSGLTSVSLPNSLTRIRNSAFNNCDGLESITIPGNVGKLGSETFVNCDSLTSVTFAGGIEGLETNTFGTSSLRAVYYNSGDVDMSEWPDQDIIFINSNGGTITNGPAVDPDYPKFPASTPYTPPGGKQFRAYNVNGIYYGAGDYMPEGKVKASVRWDDFDPLTDKAPVLFMANGHGTAPKYQIVSYGDPAVRPNPDPTADGYTFDGWYLSPDGTKPWDFDTKVFRAIILYAKWTGNVTVTFDVNGHGTAPNPIEVETGNPIGKPEDPTAEGYKFNGWYKERTCQTKWIFTDPVTDSMTLYAEWEVQQYRVNFDMMGHGLGPDPQMVNYGDQVTEPAAISIEGYTFGGWFKDISFENEWNFDNDFVKSDTVLYAKWVSNSGGGNGGATVPVWVLTSVIAGSVIFVGAAVLLLRRH